MKFLTILLTMLFTSCSTQAQRQAHFDSVRKASLSSGVCSIHHVPLKRGVVYGWSHFGRGTIDPSDADYRAQWKYPNSLVYFQQRTPSADYHDKQVAVYCPICQQHYEAETRQ
jgi:hypothetical protein